MRGSPGRRSVTSFSTALSRSLELAAEPRPATRLPCQGDDALVLPPQAGGARRCARYAAPAPGDGRLADTGSPINTGCSPCAGAEDLDGAADLLVAPMTGSSLPARQFGQIAPRIWSAPG